MGRIVKRPPKSRGGNGPTEPVEEDLTEPEEVPAETETPETPEVPPEEAQVEVKMKGPATAVRNAARRIGNEPPAESEEQDEEPVEDPLGRLLSDTGNMVIVTRLLPRVVRLADGSTRRCSGRVEKYPCPITMEELEDDVFGRFGGKKFKVTIHPAGPAGEMKKLGGFVIENPDEELPIFPDDPDMPRDQSSRMPNDVDPTLMPHPDPLVRAEQQAAKRYEDALRRQRIKELEKQARDAEDVDKPQVPIVHHHPPKDDAGNSRIQALEDRLALKELRTEFDSKLTRIEGLLQNQRPSGNSSKGDNDLLIAMMQNNQAQFTEMMKAITAIQKPAPVAPAAPSSEMNFDKMLDMFTKLKAALGGDDSRVKRLEETLLESAIERAMGGGEGPAEEEDTVKFAIRQMTPVLKTYVEKQIDKEAQSKGREITAEERKKIYSDAAMKAAKDLEAEWRAKGLLVKGPPPGGKMPGVPQKKVPGLPAPGQRTKTAEGEVETVVVEPAKTGSTQKPSKPVEPGKEEPVVKEEEKMPRFADLPGIGKVEIPPPPGHPAYDPKKALNFVMDSMLSEIHERVPQDRPNDSYVVGDALQCLDGELLGRFSQIDTGTELEQFLSDNGAASKVESIKKAGEDEIVKSWVKRIVITIQDHWKREAAKGRG